MKKRISAILLSIVMVLSILPVGAFSVLTSAEEKHEHSFRESGREEPTCEQNGIVMYTCYSCGDSYVEEISALGHDYVATKTTDGSVAYVCKNCGATKGDDNGEMPHAHSYEIIEQVDATCTTDGAVRYICYDCKDSYIENVPAFGHSFTEKVIDGVIVKSCNVCGEFYSDGADTGEHIHSYEQIVVREATCTDNGVVKYTCNGCDKSYTETVSAFGHNFVVDHVVEGIIVYICLNCGECYKSTQDTPHSHTYEEIRRQDASCEGDGEVTYMCYECKDSYTNIIPSTGHDYQPNRTDDGSVVYVCVNCGATEGDDNGEKPHEHSYEACAGEDPTCTKDGHIEYCCFGCGDVYVETVPAYGHDYVESKVDGAVVIVCKNCGETKEEESEPCDSQIVVESKTVSAGKQVEIAVYIENNPGFSWLSLTLEYSDELELVQVKNGELISDFTSGRNLVWAPDEDVAEDGVLMTIVFNVSDTTQAGDYDITLNLNECYDSNEQDVEFVVMDGTLTVVDYVYGDANGDGKVDGKDVVRLKNYLADYDYNNDTSSVEIFGGADANGDGSVDGKDVIRLKKYLANYDYDTDSSTVVLGPQN